MIDLSFMLYIFAAFGIILWVTAANPSKRRRIRVSYLVGDSEYAESFVTFTSKRNAFGFAKRIARSNSKHSAVVITVDANNHNLGMGDTYYKRRGILSVTTVRV